MSASELPPGHSFTLYDNWRLVNRSREYARWLHRRYGRLVTMHNRKAVIVLTEHGARDLFKADPDGFSAFWKEGFGGLIGPGSLFILDGAHHRAERALLGTPLQAHCFHRYGPLIQEIAQEATAGWQPEQELRALDAMLRSSLEFILRLGFGEEARSIRDEGRRAMEGVVETERPWFVFFPSLQAWWFPPWVRYARARERFRNFVAARLAERRARGNVKDDLLGRMMSAHYEDGTTMSDGQIADELLTILGAGHETTGTALSWALYELGQHPAVLGRLRQEIDALGPDPDPDQIVQSPYLDAVCKETLRRRTILTEVGRVLERPLELLDFTIPAGWSIVISIASIHQDPRLYPEPDRFRPERFLERTYSPFQFLPFGGGHRRCLGAALSDYEMRIVLAHIISSWEYVLLGEESEARLFIATGPRSGVRLRLTGPRTTHGPTAPPGSTAPVAAKDGRE